MTRLAERKTRCVAETSALHRGRPLVVTLTSHEVWIREKGRRLLYAVPYSAIYETGAKLAAIEARRLKAESRTRRNPSPARNARKD